MGLDKMLMSLKAKFEGANKKTLTNMVVLMAVGVGMLIFANGLNKGEETKDVDSGLGEVVAKAETISETGSEAGYVEQLEQKLKKAFSEIQGVGRTEIVITLAAGREIVVSEDVTSEQSATLEEADGSSKQTSTHNRQSAPFIISGRDGVSSPLIIKEIEPKIEGIVIIAEGGNNEELCNMLSYAAQALLNIPAHKVQIFKMK